MISHARAARDVSILMNDIHRKPEIRSENDEGGAAREGRKRTRDPDGKRRALQSTAMQLFATRGFEAVSIADIAREAGMAVGTVYRFYPNKIALLRAMHDALEERFVACLVDAWSYPEPPADRLDTVCDALFELMDERRQELRVLSMTTDVMHEDGRLPGDAVRSQIATMIADAQRSGAFRKGDPVFLAAMAHGTVEGAMRHWLRTGGERHAVARATAIMLRRGIVVRNDSPSHEA